MGQRHNGEHALGEHVTSPVRRGLMSRLGLAVKSEAGKPLTISVQFSISVDSSPFRLADDIGSVLHFGSLTTSVQFSISAR